MVDKLDGPYELRQYGRRHGVELSDDKHASASSYCAGQFFDPQEDADELDDHPANICVDYREEFERWLYEYVGDDEERPTVGWALMGQIADKAKAYAKPHQETSQ